MRKLILLLTAALAAACVLALSATALADTPVNLGDGKATTQPGGDVTVRGITVRTGGVGNDNEFGDDGGSPGPGDSGDTTISDECSDALDAIPDYPGTADPDAYMEWLNAVLAANEACQGSSGRWSERR